MKGNSMARYATPVVRRPFAVEALSLDVMPLVGVLLVLVVTVIAAGPQNISADRLNIPPAIAGCCLPTPDQPYIDIDPSSTRVNGLLSTPQGLIPEICRAQGYPDGHCDGGRVMIRADADTPYGRVADTIAMLKQAGFDSSLLNEDLH